MILGQRSAARHSSAGDIGQAFGLGNDMRAMARWNTSGLELQRLLEICQRRTVNTGHFACVTILYNAER